MKRNERKIGEVNLSWSFIWAKRAAWIRADISDLSWSYWEHFIRKWYSFSTCFKLSQRLDTKLWHFGWRQYRRSQLCIPFSQNKWETKSCIGDHRIKGTRGLNRELYVLSLSDFKHSCLNLNWSLSDNEFLSKLNTIFGGWVKTIADRLFLATISDISLDHVDNRGLHWAKCWS